MRAPAEEATGTRQLKLPLDPHLPTVLVAAVSSHGLALTACSDGAGFSAPHPPPAPPTPTAPKWAKPHSEFRGLVLLLLVRGTRLPQLYACRLSGCCQRPMHISHSGLEPICHLPLPRPFGPALPPTDPTRLNLSTRLCTLLLYRPSYVNSYSCFYFSIVVERGLGEASTPSQFVSFFTGHLYCTNDRPNRHNNSSIASQLRSDSEEIRITTSWHLRNFGSSESISGAWQLLFSRRAE